MSDFGLLKENATAYSMALMLGMVMKSAHPSQMHLQQRGETSASFSERENCGC